MKRYLLFFVFVITIFSCRENQRPDISGLIPDLEIIRTENQLAEIESVDEFNQELNRYPDFYKILFKNVMGFYNYDSPDSLFYDFYEFRNDSLIQEVQNLVNKKYSDLKGIKSELASMYGYIEYYFPGAVEIPSIYTFISDFDYQVFLFEDGVKDGVGIGLDMFLSPEIPYKLINPDNTNFSDYITRSWNKDHITKRIAELYLEDLAGEAPGLRLIDQMIQNGKELYLLSKILPTQSDTVLCEFTKEQMNWCQENEPQMWSFFLDQKLFYETNPMKIGKYINPAPNSPDMPPAAPGRTANYLGWQVVKAFMNRYPETSLQDLMAMKDSQAFLEKSKYKPKRRK